MKFFSAFSGIGGFDEGIRRVIPNAECIGYSEIDKYAIKIYEKHFPDRINYGNIQKIRARTLPDFDMFCGGFPCQDLSIAGKRAGLCGARSSLFFEIVRIIREKQPELVFLENVKGLLSSNEGWDFATVLIELEKAGYDCEWDVLNSKNFGVPQNRERVFIIGHLRGNPWKPVFPIGEDDKVDINKRNGLQNSQQIASALRSTDYKGTRNVIKETANCLDANYHKGWLNHGQRTMIQVAGTNQGNRVYSSDGLSKCISNGGGGSAKTGLIIHNMQPRSPDRPSAKGGGCGHLTRDDGITYCLDSNPQAIEVKRVPLKLLNRNQKNYDVGDYSFTVDVANTSGIQVNSRIRRLTPLECERLQGYPDGWTEGISDTQRYKCLGNAVTVNVIEAIVKRILFLPSH